MELAFIFDEKDVLLEVCTNMCGMFYYLLLNFILNASWVIFLKSNSRFVAPTICISNSFLSFNIQNMMSSILAAATLLLIPLSFLKDVGKIQKYYSLIQGSDMNGNIFYYDHRIMLRSTFCDCP